MLGQVLLILQHKQNPPSMYIDWIRVYVNDNYAGKKAPKVRYY